jgi:hypothetical protein
MTRDGITAEMVGILAKPTPKDEVKQRQGPGGRMLDYVDARFVMDRLDEIGAENWQDRFEDRANGSVRCGIGVLVDGEWVWKWDVGTESDIESEKGSYSDAFKRAGVKWGIARDLYGHPTTNGRAASAPPAARPAPAPRPAASTPPAGGVPEEPDWLREQEALAAAEKVFADVRVEGGECPIHHLAWTLKPGGVSKTTGKPYDAFWACPSQDRPFCKEKPGKAWAARRELVSA